MLYGNLHLLLLFSVKMALSSISRCPHRLTDIPPAKGNIYYLDGVVGDDGNIGGPYRTFHGAIAGIRNHRNHNDATLFVRSARYYVTETISLDKKDSGLSIIGHPDNLHKPVISGGFKIPGSHFESNPGSNIFSASYEGPCSKHIFLGRKRLIRARKPNLPRWNGDDLTGQGPYLTIKGILEPTPDCDMQGSGGFKQMNCSSRNKDGFIFGSGDIDPTWKNPTTGEILVFQAWTAERGHINNITNDNKVLFDKPLRFPLGKHPKPSGWRYIVENIQEELDAEGEFFCDEKNKMLHIIPPAGALETEDVYVSTTSSFFKVRKASNVTFANLDFRHSHDDNRERYKSVPGLMEFNNVDGLIINRCDFSNVGYTAIYIKSSMNVNINKNTISDVGFFGISMEYRGSLGDNFANRNILIYRNTMRGCGVFNMFQPACIHAQGDRNIRILHNDISRTPYAGIKIGWQKRLFGPDFKENGSYVFHVSRNNVYDYGMGILNDFGGVYLSSNMACGAANRDLNTCHLHALVSHNAIHNAQAYMYGSIGVFGDTAASSLTVRKNWIYNLEDCAINFHCGQNNAAVNNMIYHTNHHRVFGTCKTIGPGEIPRQTLQIRKNVVFVTNPKAEMFGRNDLWVNDVPVVDSNMYYFKLPVDQEVHGFFPKNLSWEEWRGNTGNDMHSTNSTDPSYWDIDQYDFRLKKFSGRKLGIKSIDLRSIRIGSVC